MSPFCLVFQVNSNGTDAANASCSDGGVLEATTMDDCKKKCLSNSACKAAFKSNVVTSKVPTSVCIYIYIYLSRFINFKMGSLTAPAAPIDLHIRSVYVHINMRSMIAF